MRSKEIWETKKHAKPPQTPARRPESAAVDKASELPTFKSYCQVLLYRPLGRLELLKARTLEPGTSKLVA